MFGLFKKKSELDKLKEQYAKLQKEAFELSKTNRQMADKKTADAEEIATKIDELKKTES
jgi:predicted transcriptional regulator